MIGTTSYPVKFRFESVSFKGVDEMFGFKASMTINLLKDLTVRFEAGGRHHIILKVDGKTIIDFWGAANKYSDAENVPLEAGIHRLELEYYVFHKAGGRTPWVLFDMNVYEYDMLTKLAIIGGVIMCIGSVVSMMNIIIKRKTK